MKIVNNIEVGNNIFRHLDFGDVFLFEGEAYMRVKGEEANNWYYNAVNLETNTLAHFCNYEKITRVKGALILQSMEG